MDQDYVSSDKGKKTQQCPHCDYVPSRKDSLKQHINSVHEENKPHQCNSVVGDGGDPGSTLFYSGGPGGLDSSLATKLYALTYLTLPYLNLTYLTLPELNLT